MIELNEKTQQDFLNREWVQRLLDAGVDMSDAKYCIFTGESGKDYVTTIRELAMQISSNIVNTYTVSELLYKLHEWIYPTIDGEEYSGGLIVAKDAPFYFAFYNLKNKEGKKKTEKFFAEFEYPIESLVSLLIQCHKKDIGIATKDTGNISDK